MDDQTAVIANNVLRPEQRDGALRVLAEAQAVDGRAAVSEQGRLRLRSSETPRPGVTHFIEGEGEGEGDTPGDTVLGYGQLEVPEGRTANPAAELVVDPAARGRGLARPLVDAVLARAHQEGRDAVDFWVHGGHPAARHLAGAYGAELVRELRQMRRTGPQTEAVPLPAGIELRTFRPGEDDTAWLRLNALAFAHHPEQGSWTEQDLADRLAEPWFDPAGFFLATRDGEVVGYHWTKVHPATATEPALGEVYVVGVDPAEQGSGLGRALTAAGLRHLTGSGEGERGLEAVLLYVDADNPAAVRVYERLGFTIHEVDLMYRARYRSA
ncbi:mycothiol synthase [Streptomyces rubellomurinus]|uniref:Mycothiol acetyltransferase n=1 Tax=Streptomyces rubellomurinus (strain ATCC 31215) TaxID=359131 RepID=A0A0F2TLH2_STRR3|nr:mycothiol synthase [Streptomyces rubellomurinus]KJS63376.1 mycothiol acetyltransferase [Streptomyces rubellomurinus]